MVAERSGRTYYKCGHPLDDCSCDEETIHELEKSLELKEKATSSPSEFIEALVCGKYKTLEDAQVAAVRVLRGE